MNVWDERSWGVCEWRGWPVDSGPNERLNFGKPELVQGNQMFHFFSESNLA